MRQCGEALRDLIVWGRHTQRIRVAHHTRQRLVFKGHLAQNGHVEIPLQQRLQDYRPVGTSIQP